MHDFDELKSLPREKVTGKSSSLTIRSINTWRRKAAAGKPMAKRSFIARWARARRRDGAVACRFARSAARIIGCRIPA